MTQPFAGVTTPRDELMVGNDILSWASWTIEREQGETWQSVLNVIQLQGISDEYLVRSQVERQENIFFD